MSEINYFNFFTMQNDVVNDMDQLHMGDINSCMT
jgi:hypothetical protein